MAKQARPLSAFRTDQLKALAVSKPELIPKIIEELKHHQRSAAIRLLKELTAGQHVGTASPAVHDPRADLPASRPPQGGQVTVEQQTPGIQPRRVAPLNQPKLFPDMEPGQANLLRFEKVSSVHLSLMCFRRISPRSRVPSKSAGMSPRSTLGLTQLSTEHSGYSVFSSISRIEKEVAAILIAAGYRVTPQYPAGAYRIDLVVGDGKHGLAEECDGERYHQQGKKLEEDINRQTVLERHGWRFVRIRGSAFYRDRVAAMRPVYERLAELRIDPEGPRPEPAVKPASDLVEAIVRRAEELEREWKTRDEEG